MQRAIVRPTDRGMLATAESLIEAWLDHLRYVEDASDNTVATCYRSLQGFVDWLRENGESMPYPFPSRAGRTGVIPLMAV